MQSFPQQLTKTDWTFAHSVAKFVPKSALLSTVFGAVIITVIVCDQLLTCWDNNNPAKTLAMTLHLHGFSYLQCQQFIQKSGNHSVIYSRLTKKLFKSKRTLNSYSRNHMSYQHSKKSRCLMFSVETD
jgi:hypothetical protein